MNLSRRSFIKLAGTTAACACLGALGTAGCASGSTSTTPPAPAGSYRVQEGRIHLDLSVAGALLGVGGAVQLVVPDLAGAERSVIVVRPAETGYRAFANACTHNGKELNYDHAEGLLACCGRSSRFDLDGHVLHGPAEDPLPVYPVRQTGGELVIDL
jgi:nitrite reductase/ring-hydroxylating ferredoxin subunit